MGILIQISQLLLSLSLLVLLHEFGHFFFARLFGVKVEKFYLFFNFWFSLFKYKPKNSDTEYGIGWLPLGGYCKIAGMIDESMDTEALAQEPQPWEYRGRPAWQRFFIITGGVIMNFLTAFVIYSMMLYAWGKEYLPIENATWGYHYSQLAKTAGFEDGDVMLQIDKVKPKTIGEAVEAVLLSDGKSVKVLRQGVEVEFVLPADFSQQLLASKEVDFVDEITPYIVQQVAEGSPAQAAGLQVGDSIVGFNAMRIPFAYQLSDSLKRHAGQTVELILYRNGAQMTQAISPTAEGKLGVYAKHPYLYFTTEKKEYSFFEAFPAGAALGFKTLTSYVKQFKIVFTKEGAKSLGGFGTIGGLFSQAWNWPHFWNMTAFLSIILAFMNILPIPALDGGHMMFIIYEMISGRKPSDKFLERAQLVGMVILLMLLLFANGNDIFRLFRS